MRTIVLLLAAVISVNLAVAASQEDSMLNAVISRGNRAYELSQTSRIKECADSAAGLLAALDLNEDACKDFSVSVLKLYGNYHYEAASLDSAQYYYARAKQIIDENPNTAFNADMKLLMLRELAQLYYRRKEYSKALDEMKTVDDILEYQSKYRPGDDNWLITKLTYAMCLARVGQFEEALRIADGEFADALDPSGLAYARARRMQGKIHLLAEADRKGALAAYRDYFQRQKEEALSNISDMDASQRQEYWQTLYPFIADCYFLADADPAFLYDVALFSKGLLLQMASVSGSASPSDEAVRSLSYSWRDIRKKLKKNEAAVEFIEYDGKVGKEMMALVVRPGENPRFVPLVSPDSIHTVAGGALYSTDRRDKDALYSDSVLQNLVWTESLMQSLNGVKMLYFAPDGYMHRLAVEYMAPVAEMDLCRLSSTRRLMDSIKQGGLDSALLLGSINYDLDKTSGEVPSNDDKAFRAYRGVTFPRLDVRSDEATSVFKLRENPSDTLLKASLASESVFRLLAPEYSTILISTHGDFRYVPQVSTDIKPIFDSDGMSRSVIAFSGVNSHLRGNSDPSGRYSDGLLSALELSELDLSGCRLFTVAACQSALGEVTPDGVFGLQRGLKQAGVGTMLLSLWNVNSEASACLMRQFYANINKGLPLRKAFAEARRSLTSVQDHGSAKSIVYDPAVMASRRVKSKEMVFDAPQFYDAFILIDALN